MGCGCAALTRWLGTCALGSPLLYAWFMPYMSKMGVGGEGVQCHEHVGALDEREGKMHGPC